MVSSGVEAMRDNNLLPYDGDVFLIEDDCAEFDWPGITRKLMDIIPWQVEIARIFGRAMPIPRLVAWFGDITYSYSGISHPPAPFPEVIERLRRRAETLSSGPFNSVLCNLYRSGHDSVGWHSHDEPGLGSCPPIASLSLGAERRFQLRHRRTSTRLRLTLRWGTGLSWPARPSASGCI